MIRTIASAVSAAAVFMAMDVADARACPTNNKYSLGGTRPFIFSTAGDDPVQSDYVVGQYKNLEWNRPRSYQLTTHPDWTAGSGTYAPMSAFEDAGVSQDNQHRLVFSIRNKPANPKYIAMFVGGQEGITGHPQLVTGSNAGWRQRIDEKNAFGTWTSGPGEVDNRSPAQLYIDSFNDPTGNAYGSYIHPFDLQDTLVIVVADAAFMYPGILNLAEKFVNWKNMRDGRGIVTYATTGGNPTQYAANTMKENDKMLEGWKKWLSANVNWNDIKAFWGFGMSRGGCFVTRFADHLFGTIPELNNNNAKLILETIDPVCHPKEWRKDVQNSSKVSAKFQPADQKRHWECHAIEVPKLFPNTPRGNIQWMNVITGQNIMEVNDPFVPLPTHAFCDLYTETNKQNLLYDTASAFPITDGDINTIDPFSKIPGAPAEWSAGNWNNPMPQGCQYWYKQYWVPYGHLPIGGAHTQKNINNPLTGEKPGCIGMSYCGAENVNDVNGNVAPGQKCIPHPHESLDWYWKHYKHASEAWHQCLKDKWYHLDQPTWGETDSKEPTDYEKPEVIEYLESSQRPAFDMFPGQEVVVLSEAPAAGKGYAIGDGFLCSDC